MKAVGAPMAAQLMGHGSSTESSTTPLAGVQLRSCQASPTAYHKNIGKPPDNSQDLPSSRRIAFAQAQKQHNGGEKLSTYSELQNGNHHRGPSNDEHLLGSS